MALDPDRDTQYAINYAIEIAKNKGASLTGMAIIDTLHAAAETGTEGLSNMYFANEMRSIFNERSRHEAGNLLDDFERKAVQSGIRHSEIIEEGTPSERINEDLKYHDLLVVGKESHFYYLNPDEQTQTVSNLLKRSVTPILVVPGPYKEIRKVLFAVNGSIVAARTMQWFIHLLPFGNDIAVDLVNVPEKGMKWSKSDSEAMLNSQETYLHYHNFKHIEKAILEPASPGKQLLEYVENQGVDLVVMGANYVSAIRRIILGSTTHMMVDKCTVPIFLGH